MENNDLVIEVNGQNKTVKIFKFNALDGWNLQQQFIEFNESKDPLVRKSYTFEVLKYSKIVVGNSEIELKTEALINNHLGNWENLKKVFEEVLLYNGIDPKIHAKDSTYWNEAGEQLAVSFLANVSQLIGPMLEYRIKDEKDE